MFSAMALLLYFGNSVLKLNRIAKSDVSDKYRSTAVRSCIDCTLEGTTVALHECVNERSVMAESKITTNHDEIRRWVEERGGHPLLTSSL